jgi:Putative auto-transporter adhesin, head GIN domain
MKKLSFLLLLAGTFIFSSCRKDVIRGAGSSGTRTLALPAFTSVESHYDIAAEISYGTAQEVSVTGYNNLLDILDFRVEDGVLKLKYNTRYNTIRNGNVVARIKIPVISKVAIHGSEDINITGFSNGSTLNAQIYGSGDVRVSNSNYQLALLAVHGSGKIEAQGLQTKQAEVKIHGSGHTSISVADRLKAAIFGSGNIYYWGNPAVETSQNGSGRVIKR